MPSPWWKHRQYVDVHFHIQRLQLSIPQVKGFFSRLEYVRSDPNSSSGAHRHAHNVVLDKFKSIRRSCNFIKTQLQLNGDHRRAYEIPGLKDLVSEIKQMDTPGFPKPEFEFDCSSPHRGFIMAPVMNFAVDSTKTPASAGHGPTLPALSQFQNPATAFVNGFGNTRPVFTMASPARPTPVGTGSAFGFPSSQKAIFGSDGIGFAAPAGAAAVEPGHGHVSFQRPLVSDFRPELAMPSRLTPLSIGIGPNSHYPSPIGAPTMRGENMIDFRKLPLSVPHNLKRPAPFADDPRPYKFSTEESEPEKVSEPPKKSVRHRGYPERFFDPIKDQDTASRKDQGLMAVDHRGAPFHLMITSRTAEMTHECREVLQSYYELLKPATQPDWPLRLAFTRAYQARCVEAIRKRGAIDYVPLFLVMCDLGEKDLEHRNLPESITDRRTSTADPFNIMHDMFKSEKKGLMSSGSFTASLVCHTGACRDARHITGEHTRTSIGRIECAQKAKEAANNARRGMWFRRFCSSSHDGSPRCDMGCAAQNEVEKVLMQWMAANDFAAFSEIPGDSLLGWEDLGDGILSTEITTYIFLVEGEVGYEEEYLQPVCTNTLRNLIKARLQAADRPNEGHSEDGSEFPASGSTVDAQSRTRRSVTSLSKRGDDPAGWEDGRDVPIKYESGDWDTK